MPEDVLSNGKKATRDGHADRQTARLPKWFLVLHFAAKKSRVSNPPVHVQSP